MERKGFLGGSDAVRIMNGDWHQLWLEKTGRVEPEGPIDFIRGVVTGKSGRRQRN